jgi:hypothetical protein
MRSVPVRRCRRLGARGGPQSSGAGRLAVVAGASAIPALAAAAAATGWRVVGSAGSRSDRDDGPPSTRGRGRLMGAGELPWRTSPDLDDLAALVAGVAVRRRTVDRAGAMAERAARSRRSTTNRAAARAPAGRRRGRGPSCAAARPAGGGRDRRAIVDRSVACRRARSADQLVEVGISGGPRPRAAGHRRRSGLVRSSIVAAASLTGEREDVAVDDLMPARPRRSTGTGCVIAHSERAPSWGDCR